MKVGEQRTIEQKFGDETLASEFFPAPGGPRPTVILFPTVAGISKHETGYAQRLVDLGYNGFCADLYGKPFRNSDRTVGAEQMKRLRGDRASLRKRLLAVLETAREQPECDKRVAAIGFCFGGMCALDLARSGSRDVGGVASFHGLFDPPGLPLQPIPAKVIAFHGAQDPMVPPPKVAALGIELTRSGSDWQILAFGNTVHGFTNEDAAQVNNPAVRYNPDAARRSWQALVHFLDELFG